MQIVEVNSMKDVSCKKINARAKKCCKQAYMYIYMLQIHLQNILSDLWMRGSQIASLHTVVQMGLTCWMDWHLIQGVYMELFLVASWQELRYM